MARRYPDALPVGYRLEEYEIVRVLGQGGFAITYLAKDSYRDQEVALKEYFQVGYAIRNRGTDVDPVPGAREVFDWGYRRFLDEARILQKFRHPNIPAVYRYFRGNGTAYIAMEHIEGPSLYERLGPNGSRPLAEWRRWLDRLLDALEHVHSHNYLHRDITPSNILIRESDDQPVLIDFGAARIATEERTRTVVLTEAYAPPEQRSKRAKQDPFTDIYSVAAVSYRVLTGDPPASAMDRTAGEEHQPLAQRLEAAADWMSIVDRALALRPKDRPQTVAAWRKEMNEAAAMIWLQGQPVEARDTDGLTALHRAAAEEPVPEVIALLLDYGADVQAVAETGDEFDDFLATRQTPLHRAAAANPNPAVASLLLDRGADIRARDVLGDMPLHQAARHSPNSSVVALLLDRGADLFATNHVEETPLHSAAGENPRIDVLTALLDRGSSVDALDCNGNTPLHSAAERNRNAEVLEVLLNRGCNVHQTNRAGATPLHLAASEGAFEAAQQLVLSGASLSGRDGSGCNALHHAARQDRLRTSQMLLDNGAAITGRPPLDMSGESRLDLGTLTGDALLARVWFAFDSYEPTDAVPIVRHDPDWALWYLFVDNHRDVTGWTEPTALHTAAEANAQRVARLLLDRGANPRAKDPAGRTPLHLAALNGAVETAAILLDAGSDLNIQDAAGRTPLHLAAWGNSRRVAELLLRHGAALQTSERAQSEYWMWKDAISARVIVSTLLRRVRGNGHDRNRANDELSESSWTDLRTVAEVLLNKDNTPLHWAAFGDSRDVAELLLDAGANVQGGTDERLTPLELAALGNSTSTAQLLMDRGASLSGRDGYSATPLHWAALANACQTLALLIDQGADIEAADSDGNTPLHAAARWNSREGAELLLDRGADVRRNNSMGETPLHSAASRNGLRTAKLFLHHGADYGARTHQGETPLHLAALSDSFEVAKVLVDAGADIDDQTKSNLLFEAIYDTETPLHKAAQGNAAQVAELLLESDVNIEARTNECWTPLHFASSEGAAAVAELLLGRGAALQSETQEGKTPLHLAIEGLPGAHRRYKLGPQRDKQYLALVEMLMHRGASPYARDEEGNTPLDVVVGRPSPETVEFLLASGVSTSAVLNAAVRKLVTIQPKLFEDFRWLEDPALQKRGADVNALDDDGKAPIHVAAGLNSRYAIRCLQKAGARLDLRDRAGDTALHLVARSGGDDVDSAQLLIDGGVDLEARNELGATPLHSAALGDCRETAEYLISRGARADETDNEKATPLHYAARENAGGVAQALLKLGADIDARDREGNTPLHDAIQGDAWELVEALIERGADPKPLDEYNQGWAEDAASVEERLSWAKTDRVHRLVSAIRSALCVVLQRVADKRGWHEADRQFRAIEEHLRDSGVFPRVFNYPLDERNIDLSVEELVSEQDGETLYWYLENNLDAEQTQRVVSALRNTESLDLFNWREILSLS